ncbi:MAG: hypothetical protein ACE5OP_14220 [Candidatus Glassbacteria bacterium]
MNSGVCGGGRPRGKVSDYIQPEPLAYLLARTVQERVAAPPTETTNSYSA